MNENESHLGWHVAHKESFKLVASFSSNQFSDPIKNTWFKRNSAVLYCGKTQIKYVILAKSSPQCEKISPLTDVDNGNNYCYDCH